MPDFYRIFSWACEASNRFFEEDPLINQLKIIVSKEISNNIGHGYHHATKVAIESGALVLIEAKQMHYSRDATLRRLLLVQCAGLFHDIKRQQSSHAQKGAAYSRDILKRYPFENGEVDDICIAIENHEAFKEVTRLVNPDSILISDCLYDGDKFRWGPDNFLYTIWDMVTFLNIPLYQFIDHYPKGMQLLSKIKHTFRTTIGKEYGPQFIDIGIGVGEKVFDMICDEFVDSASH
ncbi:MAG: HD domain-containing protein [Desulfobacterales bacterium]|nr:HD domain-containing protein [Desulfobacterales bacterium]